MTVEEIAAAQPASRSWKLTDEHITRYAWMRDSKPDDAVSIPLPHGLVAWVSPEDAARMANYSWHVKANKKSVYVVTTSRARTKQGEKIGLHRIVMGDVPGLVIDHKDGNTLDCRRSNLRHVTRLANAWNYHGPARGVKQHRNAAGDLMPKWRALITRGSKTVNLGLYATKDKAVAARLAAEACVRDELGINEGQGLGGGSRFSPHPPVGSTRRRSSGVFARTISNVACDAGL